MFISRSCELKPFNNVLFIRKGLCSMSCRKEIFQRIYCKQASLCVSSMTSRGFLLAVILIFEHSSFLSVLGTSRFYLVSIAQRLFCQNKAVQPICRIYDMYLVMVLLVKEIVSRNWHFLLNFSFYFYTRSLKQGSSHNTCSCQDPVLWMGGLIKLEVQMRSPFVTKFVMKIPCIIISVLFRDGVAFYFNITQYWYQNS